jgi:single-strand DNA-binding protein
MLNRVVLVGRLTKDPEMKYTPQGVAVAQMSIAVQRVTKNESGDYDVDFFDIVAWRRTAEFASNYLQKGRLVSVDGRLQTRSWVAQDGSKRKVVEIVADNIDTLERRPDGEGPVSSDMGASAPAAPAPTAARASAPAATGGGSRSAAPAQDEELDESDPFADE